MSSFFVPPPVVGPIPFDATFSEFSVRRVGDVDPPSLGRLEKGLRRHNFTRARADIDDTVRIVVTSRICHELVAEVEAMKKSCGGPVLVVSLQSRDGLVDPWRVLDAGADDLLIWDEEEDTIGAIAARLRRWRETQLAIESLRGQGVVVGVSRVWRKALAQLVEAAKFGVAPVLIVGETGTGKELLARCVHGLDPRPAKGELVLVDGATLNPELSGSELFGHEKGAFTGALTRRDGALARAHGGTIFLDEVGEIPAAVQGELLRAVQDGLYKLVGGDRWMESSFRLVCATNRDLAEEVERGGFRRDLFFRIAGSIVGSPRSGTDPKTFLRWLSIFLRAGGPALRPDWTPPSPAFFSTATIPET